MLASFLEHGHPLQVSPAVLEIGFPAGSFQLSRLNPGTRRIAEEYAGRWHCIEYETQLNTPGNEDGLSRLWIDDELEVEVLHQNFVERFADYGINSVYLESYWNTGSPAATPQSRVFDNLVVSTERVGCGRL